MSLVLFEDTARAHFGNHPASWHILPAHGDSWWKVVDNDGAIVECCTTKAQAEQSRHSGPAATRWYQRTDWYLGYARDSRSLTGSERLIIDDIIERVTASADTFRRATVTRSVRFVDQGRDDNRIWDAALLPNGSYQVQGDYFHTYDAADLDFLDDQATGDFTTFLREILQGPQGDPDRRTA